MLGRRDKKDLFILEAIQKFLGVGKVYVQGANSSVEYRVFSIKELEVVLDHFDKFPLISSKNLDYKDWKYILELQNLNPITTSYLDIANNTRKDFNSTRTTYKWDHLNDCYLIK